MSQVIISTDLLERIRADLERLQREESWKHYPNRVLVAEVVNRNIGRINGVLEFGKTKGRV